jgi:hypothetical protein
MKLLGVSLDVENVRDDTSMQKAEMPYVQLVKLGNKSHASCHEGVQMIQKAIGLGS